MPYHFAVNRLARPSARRTLVTPWLFLCAVLAGHSGESPTNHWSLQPVVRPSTPRATGPEGSNPIDRFIALKLANDGLQSAPPADRRTLVRRLYYDLAGLPPTPEEAARFVSDSRPDAYERLVDSLLDSPRFGERWARHWLDVVRFAETHGFEMNNPRPNAWPYRDYVVRAFNEDKPYNHFVSEQLAGDSMGAGEATGFLVAGPWDQVKSPDEVLTKNQRADELHDMVSTVGSALLGLTVGCSRCHDHKFDPIPQADYYALKAVLDGVQHGEREQKTADTPERRHELDDVQTRLARIAGALSELEPLAQTGDINTNRLRAPVNSRQNIDRFAPASAKRLRFTILATSGDEPCIDELEVFAAGRGSSNIALASLGAKASASGTYAGSDLHKLEHVNDGRYGNGRSWISNERGKGWVQIEFPTAVSVDRVIWARDREGKFSDRLASQYRIEVGSDSQNDSDWRTVASSADRQKSTGSGSESKLIISTLSPANAARFKALDSERRQLEARADQLRSRPMTYAGTFSQPEPTHRFYRGDPMQPREEIAPGALTRIGHGLRTRDLTVKTAERERRMALAEWITDPDNPLTARVIVNRLWQHHFGEGLVATPSDFGVNGARPTHPELLDWLASELMDHNWSLKHIHRLIVTSATYRQASTSKDPKNATLHDPANHLLGHYPALRLDAEPIRDGILAVCGQLDLRMGGPGWSPFVPNDNYVRVYAPKQTFEPSDFRRMIYATVVRQRPEGVFGVFDCPDGGQIAPKRTRSTTPLQALNLLNSGFTMQAADMFADRLEKECPRDSEAQARRAFMLAYQRAATPDELKASIKFIGEEGLSFFCRAILNSNEFVYVF